MVEDRPRRRLWRLAMLLALGVVPTVATASAELCRDAARRASVETGVPLRVLMAVSLTETGRRDGDRTDPWPWALNLGGQSVWAETHDEALRRARAARASGRQNFDLGCFQINYRWHGEAFGSLDEMLNPDRNALYAAEFLARLHRELGDWSRAAGRYHSATPVHADRYRQVFDTHLAALGDDIIEPAPSSEARANRFPLLRAAGPSGGMGSLLPRNGAGVALLTGASGPFWSGS